MDRYQSCFTDLKEKNKLGLIPFLTIMDPNYNQSLEIAKSYIDQGVAALELGFPFSDPIADGPTIQKSHLRALANRPKIDYIIKFIYNLREYNSNVPLGMLSYLNPIYKYGASNFFKETKQAGLDSILIVDLPTIESQEIQAVANNEGQSLIYIVPPNIPSADLAYIAQQKSAYVYLMSRAGVTGVDMNKKTTLAGQIEALRDLNSPPIAVGFGISSPQQVAEIKEAKAQAAIVGSALVKIIQDNLNSPKHIIFKSQELIRALLASC